MQEEFKGFWKIGLVFGLFSAIINATYLFFKYNYFWQVPLQFQASSFISYLIYILIIAIAGIYLRNKHEFSGIGSRQLFQVFFIIILMTEFTYFLYNYIYLVHINPDFTNQLKEVILQHLADTGQSQENMDAYVEELAVNQEDQNSLRFHIRGVSIWIVIDSIIGILLSLFMKRQSKQEII